MWLLANAASGRRSGGASSVSSSGWVNRPGSERSCMSAPDFLDTNVLVYAYDPTDRRKQQVAQQLIQKALDGESVLSVQVLVEFAATLLHKMSPPAEPENVTAVLGVLSPIRLIAPDGEMVRRAVEARAQYGLHFYDGS